MTMITTSGALVTLLLAFITWSSQQRHFSFSLTAKLLISFGITFLLMAVLCGIFVNTPMRALEIDADSLLSLAEGPLWDSAGIDTQRDIAKSQAKVLITARLKNRRKARFLMASACAQIIGLAMFAGTAVSMLL
jgi:hypothetical protein